MTDAQDALGRQFMARRAGQLAGEGRTLVRPQVTPEQAEQRKSPGKGKLSVIKGGKVDSPLMHDRRPGGAA